ncbi:MAG: autotransporter-associated beta strand repeat-containing protein, partial [Verrucomicrobiaceae bacterium]|nr:autotransporter-associated beta strand repeat-containing protein [Verrucomicrobiaceae bacterium]
MKPSKSPFLPHSVRGMLTAFQAMALSLFVTQAQGGNTWDGGGGDNNWGTGANWNPDGSPAPGSGNDLFFGGSTRLTPFNNYTAFDDWRNITFNTGAGSFNITGNAIDLFGKIENLSSNTQTFGLGSIALNSATANEFNPVNGNLTITSANIFTNGNQLKVFGNNGFTLSFASGTNIQQAGSVAINQNSTVIYNSAHSYSGDTFINAGKLQFASGGSANGSIIRIGDTSGTAAAEFDLTAATGGQSLGNTIVSRPGSVGFGTRTLDSQNTSGTNALTGVIALDAPLTVKQAAGGSLNLTGSFLDVKQQTLTVEAAGSVDVSKPLNSSFGAGGMLIKQGAGTLTLSNASNNYTGTNNTTLNA